MVELAFRAYCDGANLVGVAFQADTGGGPVLRQSIPLKSLGLTLTQSAPSQLDMAYDVFSVRSRKDLERGGLKLVVNYDKERVWIAPISPLSGTIIPERRVDYTFDTFGFVDERENPIHLAKRTAEFTIRETPQPISDETWP